MNCSICEHAKRVEIERACLLRDFGDTEVTLRDIAKEYDVDLKDLQVHVLMHIPLEESNQNINDATESIASKIKTREADILRQVMEDSYVTFKNLNSKINTIVSQHTTDTPTLVQITKSVTDLYLGTSQSIRENAEKLLKYHLTLNGEADKGLESLSALIKVLHPGDK